MTRIEGYAGHVRGEPQRRRLGRRKSPAVAGRRRHFDDVSRRHVRQQPIEPYAPPVLRGVPAAGAVQDRANFVGAGREFLVRNGSRRASGGHAHGVRRRIDGRNAIEQPRGERHRRRVVGTGLVGAGRPPPPAGQSRHARDALDGGKRDTAHREQTYQPHRVAAGQIGDADPLRPREQVRNEQRRGHDRGADMDLHRGQPEIRVRSGVRVREAGDQRHDHADGEQEAARLDDDAAGAARTRETAAHDQLLPRYERQHGDPGDGVRDRHDSRRPQRSGAEREPSGRERGRQHHEQREIRTPSGASRLLRRHDHASMVPPAALASDRQPGGVAHPARAGWRCSPGLRRAALARSQPDPHDRNPTRAIATPPARSQPHPYPSKLRHRRADRDPSRG
jgi:hypothetical protein